MSKILIVEDEEAIADLERDYLELSGFTVEVATDGDIGLQKALNEDYDLLILDLMLPGTDGFDICRQVRDVKNTPIVMVSAKKDDIDKIRGLGLGADDYMTKPFNPEELVARVESQLRRIEMIREGKNKRSNVIRIGGLEVDESESDVTVDGRKVRLTPIEHRILLFLVRNAGTTYSSTELYENIWGEIPVDTKNIVAVHIRHIREKIEIDPKNPRYVKVVWGRGYKIQSQTEN